MAVLQYIYIWLHSDGCSHTALNATYYTLHYILAPTVSLLHRLPFKVSFFRLSEHSDEWVQGKYSSHLWSSGKFVHCVVSDKCILEGLFPTVTSESAGSSLDPAVRSVCTHTSMYVCVWIFPFDAMHKSLYCEERDIHVFFNCVSTEFCCCRVNGLLCVLFLQINYS